MKRNGTWEYTVQEHDPKSGSGVWRTAEHMLQPPSITLTEAQRDQALKRCRDFHEDNENVKDSRLRENQKALDKLDIAVGDDVVIKFRSGPAIYRVVRIDRSLGKVGIPSSSARGVRLIEARHVHVRPTDVAPIPVNLITERMLDDLQADGLTRVRFKRDTQESYVIAFTRELAKDTRWDSCGSSSKVYFDQFYKLFWRATGFE